MEITPPPAECPSLDRQRLCRSAIRPALIDVVQRSVNAGWDEEEVLIAVGLLSDHLLTANDASGDLVRMLQEIHEMRLGKPAPAPNPAPDTPLPSPLPPEVP